MSTLASREQIERLIKAAFAGVKLGNGVSLRQAEAIDGYGEGVSAREFRRLPASEVVDSWEQVPLEELERGNIPHLDPEGFRYYIPALMLSIFESYDPTSMRVIGTLGALYPKDYVAEYHMPRYNILTYEQKQAIASYLKALPELVPLDNTDPVIVERAMRHWGEYLPGRMGE